MNKTSYGFFLILMLTFLSVQGQQKKKITLATMQRVKPEEKVILGVSYLGYMTQTEFKGE